MKMNKTTNLLIIIFILAFSYIDASAQGIRIFNSEEFVQDRQQAKDLKNARSEMSKANYHEAKSYYEKLLESSPNNPDLLFETGLAYYNSKIEKEKSEAYFQKALDNSKKDTIPELIYYLARSQHFNSNFEEAKESYKNFERLTRNNDSGMALSRDVKRYIEMCDNGIRYSDKKDEEIIIENLGGGINTIYPEYAPIVNNEGNMMIFTSRKEGSTGGKFYHDSQFYEDIYISLKEGDDWGQAVNIDSTDSFLNSKINTKDHDAAINFSKDEKKLFIYRKNDIWVTEKGEDGTWGEPEKLNANINTKGHEPSAYLSADGQILYFVSNRDAGFGGSDIYVSEKQEDGSWGEAQNLGPNINTDSDEDAPYISDDGNTLYFSSKGHSSMGGFDVFKSVKDENGEWSPAENLGAPVNTPGDDIFFKPNEDEEFAYYSSSMPKGFGDMDIYKVYLKCKNIPNTEIRGIVMAGENNLPLEADIKVRDKKSGEIVGNYTSDATTGKYLLILPPNKDYELTLESEDYMTHQVQFSLPRQCEAFDLYHEVSLNYIFDEDDANKAIAQVGTFHEAFFDIETQAKQYYNIDDLTTAHIDTDDGVERMDIISKIMHNDAVPAVNTKVFLVNSKGEIVGTTATNQNGTYRFNNVKQDEEYSVLIDESDLKISYYGDSEKNTENSVIVKGNKFYNEKDGEPIKGMPVYMVKSDKAIVNHTKTDKNGYFVIDNLPEDADAIAQLNEEHAFPYNIEVKDKDIVYSNYIKTLKEGHENYRVLVDSIPIKEDEKTPTPKLAFFENILFDFDKHNLRDKSKKTLDKVYAYLNENESVVIELHGHTDFIGTEAYNMKLSERRAKAAYNYLAKKGIDKDRMIMKWFGEEKPVAANINPDGSDNPEGRQLNRRTEFKLKHGHDMTFLTH